LSEVSVCMVMAANLAGVDGLFSVQSYAFRHY
jgi:hypothetical protein